MKMKRPPILGYRTCMEKLLRRAKRWADLQGHEEMSYNLTVLISDIELVDEHEYYEKWKKLYMGEQDV